MVETHRAADAGALAKSAAPARIEPPRYKAVAAKLRNDFRLLMIKLSLGYQTAIEDRALMIQPEQFASQCYNIMFFMVNY